MTRVEVPLAVLFDLDGTLLDTAPDMSAALNALRALEGLPPLPYQQVRPHVSHGAARLVEIGFGCREGQRFESLRQRYLELYSANLSAGTRPFEGIEAVLSGLEASRIPWGVVTNKPAWLTDPLMAAMNLDGRAGCVISGDTLTERKPHPLPLLHAARLLGRRASGCAYIGDAERDIQAGRAAGMRTLVAAFGYLSAQDDPLSWQPDAIVRQPGELLETLGIPATATDP